MSSAGDFQPLEVARFQPGGLWSLWDMLQSYVKIYNLALELGSLRSKTEWFASEKFLDKTLADSDLDRFRVLLETMPATCEEFGLIHTAELARRAGARPVPRTNGDMFSVLRNLDDSLSHELGSEAVFRVSPERKKYYDQDHLFGIEISAAFPSCDRDIRDAGNCYALGQAGGCVHHLMLVLERGLNALAVKVGVPYQRVNWQNIIDRVASELKALPKGEERDFLNEANSQFGYLKNTYRNHSEHARDEAYDLDMAQSTLNHVKGFMRSLEKGGLTE